MGADSRKCLAILHGSRPFVIEARNCSKEGRKQRAEYKSVDGFVEVDRETIIAATVVSSQAERLEAERGLAQLHFRILNRFKFASGGKLICGEE